MFIPGAVRVVGIVRVIPVVWMIRIVRIAWMVRIARIAWMIRIARIVRVIRVARVIPAVRMSRILRIGGVIRVSGGLLVPVRGRLRFGFLARGGWYDHGWRIRSSGGTGFAVDR
jgi:hypothetical protein